MPVAVLSQFARPFDLVHVRLERGALIEVRDDQIDAGSGQLRDRGLAVLLGEVGLLSNAGDTVPPPEEKGLPVAGKDDSLGEPRRVAYGGHLGQLLAPGAAV